MTLIIDTEHIQCSLQVRTAEATLRSHDLLKEGTSDGIVSRGLIRTSWTFSSDIYLLQILDFFIKDGESGYFRENEQETGLSDGTADAVELGARVGVAVGTYVRETNLLR